MSGVSPGYVAYKLGFELSPIILTNGIAGLIPGAMLPIISLTEALNFGLGILSGAEDLDLNDFFANFDPVSGGTIIENQIGTYPFANQAVAANAIISQPLRISLLMNCPARDAGGYAAKTATMLALQSTIAGHVNQGGTFTVMTPSYFYTNCILTALRDVSDGSSHQRQIKWQWEFMQPLLTESAADSALNSLMSKIGAGTPFGSAPSWSGLAPAVGSPASLAAPSLLPAASNAPGAGVALPGSLPEDI